MATMGSGEAAGRRLLLAVGAAVSEVAALPVLVRSLLDAASDILVITPVLPSRLEWLASDTDKARYEADERLGTLLGQLEEMDLPAAGQVGDETPLTALDDAVRTFAPDHILIALRSSQDADWQERGLLDQVRKRFGLPLTVFVVSDE
jgi:GABA permease